MFPLVVSTYPENGSDNVGLNDIIKVTFDGQLDVTSITADNVKLENYTAGKQLDVILTTEDAGTTIVVTASQTATGGYRYEGFNEYRLTIDNLLTSTAEMMFSTFQLRFSTVAGSVNETTNPPSNTSYMFEVIRTYPKDNGVTTPTLIKVKCSNPIAADTDTSGVMLINDSSIDEIEDALFIGENLITETSVVINGDVIEITPPTLTAGKEYSVVISKITNSTSEEIIPYMFTFNASFYPMYADVDSVLSLHIVKELAKDRQANEIARLISSNSKLAEFIANLAENAEIDWAKPPMYVGEYVKYKTQYDVVFDNVTELSSKGTMKQLKDFLVDYRFSLNDLLSLAKQLKLQYQYWEDLLKGHTNRGNAAPGVFIKGENADEIPEFMTRKLKLMDGTKEW